MNISPQEEEWKYKVSSLAVWNLRLLSCKQNKPLLLLQILNNICPLIPYEAMGLSVN